jgi:fatty acyl-CoA reductase
VNGQRQGLVLEKPFRMGDTIAKELASSEHSSSSSTVLDIEAEIKLAFDYSRRRSVDSASFAQEMKDLGLERYYSARNASVFLFFLSFSRFY